jgi:ankyrin repeat protein
MSKLTFIWFIAMSIGQSLISETLNDAIRAGDVERVKKLLDEDTDPQKRESNLTDALIAVEGIIDESTCRSSYTYMRFWGNGYQYGSYGYPYAYGWPETRASCSSQKPSEQEVAAMEKVRAIAEELLRRVADMNADSEYGKLALMIAAKFGFLNLVESLITRGADVNATNMYFKVSPLHAAASFGHTEIVRVLLKHNADFNAKNAYEQTALQVGNRNTKLAIRAWSIRQQVRLSDEDIKDLEKNNVGTVDSYNQKFNEMREAALNAANKGLISEDVEKFIINKYLEE